MFNFIANWFLIFINFISVYIENKNFVALVRDYNKLAI